MDYFLLQQCLRPGCVPEVMPNFFEKRSIPEKELSRLEAGSRHNKPLNLSSKRQTDTPRSLRMDS